MPTLYAFEYATIRVVPNLEREEFVNAGVIVFCDARDFLGARVELVVPRLRALAPAADVSLIRAHLESIVRICAGDADSGAIGRLPLRERFRWLVAPRSTFLQTSAAHGGLCEQPEILLERLHARLVCNPSASGREQ